MPQVDYINLRQNRRIVFKQRDEQQAPAAEAAAAAADGDSGGEGEGGEEGEVRRDRPLSTPGWDAVEVNP
jgi:hypothetical protein